MIATWPLGAPKENAHAIRCIFACRDALVGAASHLSERHGHIPVFRAGVHAGPLVAGEIGGFKREIALLGDTMNTAARIEQACRTPGMMCWCRSRCSIAPRSLLTSWRSASGVSYCEASRNTSNSLRLSVARLIAWRTTLKLRGSLHILAVMERSVADAGGRRPARKFFPCRCVNRPMSWTTPSSSIGVPFLTCRRG
jgi:hypothetical protein